MPHAPDTLPTQRPHGQSAFHVREFRVVDRQQDTGDTVTLALAPLDGEPLAFVPGQFTMLGRVGVGEVPISISGNPDRGLLVHTIRDVGGVTHEIAASDVGDVLEVRGPYGQGWCVEDGQGSDVVVIAGGIGLAPLRPAVLRLLSERHKYRSVSLLYGARTPSDRLYPSELARWRDHDIDVMEVVDHGTQEWLGRVGLVTTLVPRATFEPSHTLALVCGPEVMMRFVTLALLDLGVAPDHIRLSMERSMKCGVGLCGHCQLRELFVCVDGPVLDYATLAPLLAVREL
ncbi:MAG TPA: FAD/NAD(P)-binding protein [Actinomycetes bacterium]|nr:FAD/NAD(P)-binding protein [Actinomycetes bacterium]